MRIIPTTSLDPYYNLAVEEYLLTESRDDIFMLWRNDRSVIIGKNQNAYAELNLPFVEANNVKVVRRMTGGGAVFHDPGNINFTFIVNSDEKNIDFAPYTSPIIDYLRSLGADASLSGRNDILIDGRKVSGNAQCIGNGRTMHHGTLLFSANMNELAGALKVDESKIKSKGIQSVRSRVGNIADFLKEPTDILTFMSDLEKSIAAQHNAETRPLTESEIAAINTLADQKYRTWEWNFGRSKRFESEKSGRFPFGGVTVLLDTEQGKIKQAAIRGDFFSAGDISVLEKKLTGLRLSADDLRPVLEDVSAYIAGATAEDILPLLL